MGSGSMLPWGGVGLRKKEDHWLSKLEDRVALFSSSAPTAQGMRSSFQISAPTFLPPASPRPGETVTLDPWLSLLENHLVVSHGLV